MTEIVHVAFTASVLGHVFVCAKSPELVPPIAMLPIVSGAVPLFVSVTDCAALVVPTCRLANVKLEGLRLALGAAAGATNLSRIFAVIFWAAGFATLWTQLQKPSL